MQRVKSFSCQQYVAIFINNKNTGSWLYLENGRKLLDFCCGIAVVNTGTLHQLTGNNIRIIFSTDCFLRTGHSHPKVIAAAKEQIDKIVHAQVNVGYSRSSLGLIERLLTIMPPTHNSFL
jgi:4-aminobutyrate aminotransferase